MDSANDLFATIKGFKNAASDGSSPEQLLFDYCKDVLGAVERLNVDFKEKHDRRDAKLADTDKRNIAKALSGFANSSGGVLIWGIEDERLTPKPIANIEQFTANLARLATHITDPVVRDVDVEWLPSHLNDGSGFALIYVPESALPPHRVILNDAEVKNHYYIRSGESFVVATHTQLEDMFGRRPKPLLSLNTRIEIHSTSGIAPNTKYSFNVVLGMRNDGRGPAKAPFLALQVHPPYAVSRYGLDGNSNYGLKPLTKSSRTKEHQYGASADVVIHAGVAYDITAIDLEIQLTQIREIPDLVIDWRMAAEGSQPATGCSTLTMNDFWNAISEHP